MERHWFEDVADHLGPAYLRYSFTKGTEQEVAFLVEELGLRPGMRVLDVGCGPGRHAHALGRLGLEVLGVDISERFVALAAEAAPPGVSFLRADARALGFHSEFDAVISLCQGAFGLAGGPAASPGGGMSPQSTAGIDPDADVLGGMAQALKPGGRLALSAFSAYFQVRFLDDPGSFDALAGVNHELAEVRDEEGRVAQRDLWTTCFTPRELRLLLAAAGLRADAVWSVEPGAYGRTTPTVDSPEFLAVATR